MAGRRTTGRPEPRLQQSQPAEDKNFDWGKAYMRDLTTTNAQGVPRIVAGTEGGAIASDLIKSGTNISQGKGGAWDWVNVLLAPTAFAGYGAVKAAPAVAAGVKAGARTVDNAAAKAIINRTLKNPRMAVALPSDAVEAVARGGKLKNAFEVGEGTNAGGRVPEYFAQRLAAEENLLGLGPEVAAAQRPTYGVVNHGAALPQWMANRIPGATGQAARLFDYRFNDLQRYNTPNLLNGSLNAMPATVTTKPGIEGTYTIGDSLQKHSRAFAIGNKADADEATETIFKLARENQDEYIKTGSRSGVNFLGHIPDRSRSFPYIEMQANAKNNPAAFMDKFNIAKDTGLREDITPITQKITELLANSGSKAKVNAYIQSDPKILDQAKELIRKARWSDTGRGLHKLNWEKKQALTNLKMKLRELTKDSNAPIIHDMNRL